MQKERSACILQPKLVINCMVNFHGELSLAWRGLSWQFQTICSIDYIKRAKWIITDIISGVTGALHFFCYLFLAGEVVAGGNFFPTGHYSSAPNLHPHPLYTGEKWPPAPTRKASLFLFTAHRETMHSTFISFTPILLTSSLGFLSTTQEVLMVKKKPRFICQSWRANFFEEKKKTSYKAAFVQVWESCLSARCFLSLTHSFFSTY